ncbi:MAG: hypothetical protein EOP38_12955 [Rubrivivax sp.]|nr:MAG: hypothetical protein EOP38_12955 [Rubrivivax sp.]
MFFIGRKTTAELQLTTPLDQCCNCGAKGDIDLFRTRLQQTRYFLFFGTELELIETFPYCRRCKGSAQRVRLNVGSKFLVACMAIAAVFLALVLSAPPLPRALQDSLLTLATVIGIALTAGYFFIRERRNPKRSYYQPVSLVAAVLDGSQLRQLHLRFTNTAYARLFSKANADLIAARVLKVESAS